MALVPCKKDLFAQVSFAFQSVLSTKALPVLLVLLGIEWGVWLLSLGIKTMMPAVGMCVPGGCPTAAVSNYMFSGPSLLYGSYVWSMLFNLAVYVPWNALKGLAIARLGLDLCKGSAISFSRCLKMSADKVLQMIVVGLLLAVPTAPLLVIVPMLAAIGEWGTMLLSGLFLLGIPALLWWTWVIAAYLSLTVYFILEENASALDALRHAFRVRHSVTWSLAAFPIIPWFVTILWGLLPLTISLVLIGSESLMADLGAGLGIIGVLLLMWNYLGSLILPLAAAYTYHCFVRGK